MLDLATKLVLKPVSRGIWRPVIEGIGNVPRKGGVILASNHLSFIDSVVIPLTAPRRVHFLAKAEYFTGTGLKGRLSKGFFEAIGAVPVERGTYRSAQASLESALEILEDGKAFGIYPEGTRSLDGRLYRGKTGVAWLALTAGVPVVPVALEGPEQILPVGKRLPRLKKVTVRFGEPLHFDELHGQARSLKARRQVTDEVMAAIQRLSGQEVAESYNEVPKAA
ncbi:1-acyl-sn-glycerol-3-phosphate acyltransferase [Kitasatospora xanthocidica]|uniref:1-acyl-sn-glycerol-3-phosphate acyltransferase n=1 Tax=Kitasatospora xanthocidica TaxID=83382 RepID=A0A373A317_9ACTN|nr:MULTISPECIES: lysophospholipid acyltransferase family protein [Kitasatospora]RGD62556.1 1-acyl-sn-glycerol-3-phosphate acyltransferase [Kitasatospora xanthocidica]